MNDDEVKILLNQLEQEKIQLQVFGTGDEIKDTQRITEILEQMQPLYKQLGGIYTSETNANYMQIVLYVVYDHPSDFPEEYVIRKHFITKDGTQIDENVFFKSKDLQECENKLKGLHKIPRDASDDPVIICTYI